jgi:hypothetical protein
MNKKYRRGAMMKPMYGMGAMLKKYMNGGMMYNEGAMLTGDGDPEKDISPAEALELLAAKRGGVAYGSSASNARELPGGGYTTVTESTAAPIIAALMGLGESEDPEAPRPGERMDPVDMRGPRVIKNRRDRELVGERQDIPERQEEKDYGFRVMRDPDHFRHPYGKSITTAKTGEETDTSGMMGVKMGNTAYYMPNARGYTGPKGKFVRDFREIKDKFGEEAYMQALGMLEEQGADISRLVD